MNMKIRRFLAILGTRNKEFWRDRAALAWNLLGPLGDDVPFGAFRDSQDAARGRGRLLPDDPTQASALDAVIESTTGRPVALAVRYCEPYEAVDPRGPWSLVQGNIESECLVDPAEAKQLFYRVGPYEESPVQQTELFADDFEGYANSDEIETLGGWTIINGAGDAAVQWQLWNTGGEPLNSESPDLVGMTENYVISDSDFGPDSALDEELISPVIDCAGYSQVQLDFNSNMRIYEDDQTHMQITDLDLSVYDADAGTWSDWKNMFRRDMTKGSWSSESPRSFSLSPFADGRHIKLRWRFYDAVYDYWWAIDDVKVTAE